MNHVGRAGTSVGLSAIDIAVFNQDLDLRYTWIYQPQVGYTVEEVIGKTDAELIPAEPCDHVCIADHFFEPGRYMLDQPIAERMTEAVIDELKAV